MYANAAIPEQDSMKPPALASNAARPESGGAEKQAGARADAAAARDRPRGSPRRRTPRPRLPLFAKRRTAHWRACPGDGAAMTTTMGFPDIRQKPGTPSDAWRRLRPAGLR